MERVRNWLAFNILTGRAVHINSFWCPSFRSWFPRAELTARVHCHNGINCNCLLAREGAQLATWPAVVYP